MLNRRLITLFILFTVGFIALGLRLAKLQVADAGHWQEQMQNATRRTYSIDTARGAILDRNGAVLAKDVPCDDLAIDYRAMNLDDQWLSSMALKRIASEKFDNAAEKRRRRDEMKKIIAEEVDQIPDAISQACHIPREDILARYEDIRQRIHLLHQDLWFRKYDRRNPAATDAEENDPKADDEPLDLTYRKEDLTDERRAHTIVHNLPPALANYFRQNMDRFPGLLVRDDANLRVYPNGEVASQVIGTLRTVGSDEIARGGDEGADNKKLPPFKYPDFKTDNGNLSGYQPGDSIGESGAEKVLERYLHGAGGAGLHVTGSSAEADQRIEPVPGKDVRLTLDIALQRDIHNALKDPAKHLLWGTNTATDQMEHKDHFVAMVILRIADGQILTMISSPSYDPNLIDQTRVALNRDEYRRPLANRALEAHAPGSTVKPLLATAGLMEGVITPETTIVCNGYLFPDHPRTFRCSIYVETNGHASHGPLQLEDAIAESCNIYFYTLGGRLGIDKITQWLGAYGLAHDTGCELYEQDGFLPKLTGPRDANEERTESLLLGIGEGYIGATPLQMANAYATLLRGGLPITPRLILGNPPQQGTRIPLDPNVVATVRAGMEGVVSHGTAKEIFRGMHLPIGGKTGTADTSRPMFDEATGEPLYDKNRPLLDGEGHRRLGPDGQPLYARMSKSSPPDAWFVAYAPADNPQYVVAAVMEFGGFGGKAAAPMVKEALLQMERHGYLEKMDVPAE